MYKPTSFALGQRTSILKIAIAILIIQVGLMALASAATPNPDARALGIDSLKVDPALVTGGTSATGTVTLSGAAPAGGVVVSLASSSAAAGVPRSVTVSAGATEAPFSVTTTAQVSDAAVTLTATLGTARKDGYMRVVAPQVESVTVAPGSISLGQTATGTITLTGPAAGNVTVKISFTGDVVIPGKIYLQQGQTTGTFQITTTIVSTGWILRPMLCRA